MLTTLVIALAVLVAVSLGGGRLGGYLPGQLLLAAFALMVIVTAVAMLRGRRAPDPAKAHSDLRPGELPVGRVLLEVRVLPCTT